MKEIIKEIMDNQGLSLGGFCDKYNIKRNKIESIFYYNKNNLSDFEINTIKNLRLIKPNKIRYINEELIITIKGPLVAILRILTLSFMF